MTSTTVWCVLRSGGEYRPAHVVRLARQVERHGGGRLHCLTDVVDSAIADVPQRKLEHDWPGWFAKLELYGVPGPVLYLDLDVTVVGDLRPMMDLAARREIVMCRGFWGDEDPNPLNSSIVGWGGDLSSVRDAFALDPARNIERCGARDRWGDQGFVAHLLGWESVATWQENLPGSVRSFKREVRTGSDLPAAVVASHGKPRPWDLGGADEWLRSRGVAV